MPTRENWIVSSVCSFCCFLIFGSIFCGCFFGIYYDFLKQYKQASCQVKSQKKFTYPIIETSYTYYQFTLSIFINGKTYPAFACEADTNRFLSSQVEGYEYYAYDYQSCSQFAYQSWICSFQQEILPRWLCSDIGQIEKSKNQTKCWYALSHTRSTDPDMQEVNSYYLAPQQGNHYIQVIFDEKPWIPLGEYWTMMILNLGFLVLLPLSFCLFVSLPLSIDPQFYKKLKNRGVNWYWKCKKFIRVRILVCWKYYDPEVRVDNRGELMLFAMITGKSKGVVKNRFVKSIYEYMGNNQ